MSINTNSNVEREDIEKEDVDSADYIIEEFTDDIAQEIEEEGLDDEIKESDLKVRKGEKEDTASTTLLQAYYNDIKDFKTLTREDEIELFTKLKETTDEKERKKIKERIINSNLRLVLKIAKKYYGRGLSPMDLIQEGNIGLMESIDRFDISRECKFCTYAVFWIRQEMFKAITKTGKPIYLPRTVMSDQDKIKKAIEEIENNGGNAADIKEIARISGLKEKRVKTVIQIPSNVSSLNVEIGEDGNILDVYVPDHQIYQPEEEFEMTTQRKALLSALKTLTPKEERVLKLRYGLEDGIKHSMEDTGQQCGVSKQRIQQIEDKALKRLRHASRRSIIEGDGYDIDLE